MPGFLGDPAVTIITSEFLILEKLFEPATSTSNPSTGEDSAISRLLLPAGIPFLAISNKITSANSFNPIR